MYSLSDQRQHERQHRHRQHRYQRRHQRWYQHRHWTVYGSAQKRIVCEPEQHHSSACLIAVSTGVSTIQLYIVDILVCTMNDDHKSNIASKPQGPQPLTPCVSFAGLCRHLFPPSSCRPLSPVRTSAILMIWLLDLWIEPVLGNCSSQWTIRTRCNQAEVEAFLWMEVQECDGFQ